MRDGFTVSPCIIPNTYLVCLYRSILGIRLSLNRLKVVFKSVFANLASVMVVSFVLCMEMFTLFLNLLQLVDLPLVDSEERRSLRESGE